MATTPKAYDLAFEADGTSWPARENLTDILRRELLGPADGDTEALEVPPDTRYLLGRIAPFRLASTTDVPTSAGETDREDSTLDLGDDLDARSARGGTAIPGAARPRIIHGDGLLGHL